ncbi:hypothetical protein JNB91_11935 [Rhizobium wenxiniae]|nr:hypothetical protein [Rhizobium wenxiniae]
MMRHRFSSVSAITILAGVLPQAAAAQDAATETALAPIVITSTKRSEDYFVLPSTVDIATAEDLQVRSAAPKRPVYGHGNG